MVGSYLLTFYLSAAAADEKKYVCISDVGCLKNDE